MTEAEIYSQLTDVFRSVFGDDAMELTPKLKAGDVPGWDSLKMISILMATEQRFGIKMRSREVDKLSCVGDLVGLIGSKVV